jgi:hypothetical protein
LTIRDCEEHAQTFMLEGFGEPENPVPLKNVKRLIEHFAKQKSPLGATTHGMISFGMKVSQEEKKFQAKVQVSPLLEKEDYFFTHPKQEEPVQLLSENLEHHEPNSTQIELKETPNINFIQDEPEHHVQEHSLKEEAPIIKHMRLMSERNRAKDELEQEKRKAQLKQAKEFINNIKLERANQKQKKSKNH